MLKIISIKNPEEKRSVFEQLDILKSTWVVSDLTSKLSFQKELFQKHKIIEDESLLRAHELWTKMLVRLRPDLKIISKDTAQVLIQKTLEEANEEWMKRPGVPSLLLQYMQALLPVLSHPENHDVIKDFFTKNIESYQRWGHWYLLSYQVFNQFMDMKLVMHSWISSILLNEDLGRLSWKKDFYFDLGAQLLPVEAELILALSKHKNITVLSPHAFWSKNYRKSLKSYENFKVKEQDSEVIEQTSTVEDYIKVSTCLSEVQYACSKIRSLLDTHKIKPSEIALTAPDVGIYWPCIKEYFDTEGVPLNRHSTATFITFPEFQQWLSQLKVYAGDIERGYIESSLASRQEFPLRHEKFMAVFANIYSEEELSSLNLEIGSESLKTDHITLHVFLNHSFKFWKENWSLDKMKLVVERVYAEFPTRIEFSFQTWLAIFEQKLAKMEIVYEAAAEDGIEVVDLISLKDLKIKYVFMLGLTDQNLRSKSNILISDYDADYLKQNYGYLISDSENNDLEFELVWNLNNRLRSNLLFFAQSDFNGTTQAPSHIWLKGAVSRYGNKIPVAMAGATRLSELQAQEILDLGGQKGWSSEFSLALKDQLEKDFGIHKNKIQDINLESLSASQIEDFMKCPFIHASKKLFSLNDLPDLDLDIDYQTRGRLLHGMAELTHLRYPDLKVSDDVLSDLFDEVTESNDFNVLDAQLWGAQKNKYLKIFKKYLAFEKDWIAKFPNIKAAYLETTMQAYINPQTLDVSKVHKEGWILVKGRIDRLDVDENEKACLIIDYKFDSSRYHNFDSWFEHNEIQLAFYSYLVQEGALDKKFDVLGAVYYGFKNLNRQKGFLLEEADGYMFEVGSRQSKISLLEKDSLHKQLKEKLKDVIGRMRDGEYQPSPHDLKECHDCTWRTLCRAPHLS